VPFRCTIFQGMLCTHTDCGLRAVAAHRFHPDQVEIRRPLPPRATMPQGWSGSWNVRRCKSGIRAGRLWLVVAEIDSATKLFQGVHRCDLVRSEGLWFTPLSLDEAGQLIEGEPSQTPPDFLEIHVH